MDPDQLRVFTSSSSDVTEERKRLKEVVSRINEKGDLGRRLELWQWEDAAAIGVSREGPQSLINPELDRSDIVVLILWSRLGRGTEEEARRAMGNALDCGRPCVLIYVCTRSIPPPTDDATLDELKRIVDFRRSIDKIALYRTYETADEFERIVESDLARAVQQILEKRPAQALPPPAEPQSGPSTPREQPASGLKARPKILRAFATAALVAALIWLIPGFPNGRAPTDLEAPRFAGGFETLRGPEPEILDDENRYGPDSSVHLTIEQRIGPETVIASRAELFVLDDHDRLVRVPAEIVREERTSRFVAFRISAQAEEAFGASGRSEQDLVLAVFGTDGSAKSPAGMTWDDAQKMGGLRLFVRRVEYVGGSERISAKLEGADWIRGSSSGLTYGFWTDRMPVVSVSTAKRVEKLEMFLHSEGTRFRIKTSVDGHLLRPQKIANVDRCMSDDACFLEVRSAQGFVIANWPVEWRSESPAVIKARTFEEQRDFDAALAALNASRVEEDPWDQLWVQTAMGRIAYKRAQWTSARAAWVRASEIAEHQQVYSELSARLRDRSHLALQAGDFGERHDLLERAASIDEKLGNDVAVERSIYLRAVLDERRGAPQAFLASKRRYERALKSAHSSGDDQNAAVFAGLLAALLAEQGSWRESLELLAQYPVDSNVNAQLQRRMLVSYVNLAALEAGNVENDRGLTWASLQEYVLETLRIAEESGTRGDVAYAAIDLARIALGAGRDVDARRWVDRVRQLGESSLPTRWILPLVEAELDLRARRVAGLAERLNRFREDVLAANAGTEVDASIAALVLLGDVFLALERREEALEVYGRAEQAGEELARTFAQPRARNLSRRRSLRAHEQRIALLIEDRRVDEAFEAVERRRQSLLLEMRAQARIDRHPLEWETYVVARTQLAERCPEFRAARGDDECRELNLRVSRALEAFHEATWADAATRQTHTTTEVVSHLAADRALLSVIRMGPEWASFFVYNGKIQVRVGRDPARAWMPEIRGLTQLFVVPGTSEDAFSIAEQPLEDGTPLGARVAVSVIPYAAFGRSTKEESSSLAVIIADPTGTLEHAAEEGRAIAAQHASSVLFAGPSVSRAKVLQELDRATLFHFAGHGDFKGKGPWQSELELGEGEVLRVEDLLQLRHAPGLVVLNACRTGPWLGGEQLNLAEASLAAGSSAVLATVGAVSDESANRFVRAFYDFGGENDPAGAFRDSIADFSARGDDVWRSFRLWGTGE